MGRDGQGSRFQQEAGSGLRTIANFFNVDVGHEVYALDGIATVEVFTRKGSTKDC